MTTLSDKATPDQQRILNRQRWRLLHQVESWLETPMLLLGFAWLALLVVELVGRLTPFLESVGIAIWVIFIFDFALRFALAPQKIQYLKHNWLTLLALLIPALRVFRIARIFRVLRLTRAVRGLRLVRLLTSLNRGFKALRNLLGRRGFGFVTLLTILVTLSGAAGMLAFESELSDGHRLDSYSEALWWTAMLMTTLGSEYWPRSGEGRVLCFLLALYAFTVFGYVTATLASFFIERDVQGEAATGKTKMISSQQVQELHDEIRALREELRELRHQQSNSEHREELNDAEH